MLNPAKPQNLEFSDRAILATQIPGFRSIVLGSEFAIDQNPSYDESRDS